MLLLRRIKAVIFWQSFDVTWLTDVFSPLSSVGRPRSVGGRLKRTREETSFDDDDDDDEAPEPKLDVLRGQLDLLDEADETAAGGDNFPGLSNSFTFSFTNTH